MGLGRYDRLLQETTMGGKKPTMCWGSWGVLVQVMENDMTGGVTGCDREWEDMTG